MIGEEWKVGDTGYYVLPKAPSNGRPTTLYLAITVIKVTKKRVIVRQHNGNKAHRILMAHTLTKTLPEGAWVG